MVFESIVADLLNRLLGDYFQNFDSSKLSIGIWGGDVILRDLLLKTSALDDLGLPFKVVAGKLGTLTMKIPWKSLYTSPVELDLKDLLLLVVPSTSVAYNEEAEQKGALEAKLKQLTRLDEVRKKEQERKRAGGGPAAAAAPENDSFAEKLVTQIIKNVQIRIESIHIRYEDAVTKPSAPFAFGVALKSLKVETTDSDWKPKIISEMVQTIHKMLSLNGLSLYWNPNTIILSSDQSNIEGILDQMVEMVVVEEAGLKHVLGPIACDAKVKLTPSPEKGPLPFSLPKAIVEVVMTELAIGMTNRQFQDIMQLADAMDSMTRAQYYRKYRPTTVVTYRGHYREWWKFAYRCVAEEDVRRKQKNWDWVHIREHCQLRRAYHKAYLEKLTLPPKKKLSAQAETELQNLERRLDLFNLTLIRKNVELIVDRLPLAPEPPKESGGGWFSLSGWFGGGGGQDAKGGAGNSSLGLEEIGKKFEEALTSEEKAKLYNAIDYKEESGPIDYPREYVEYNLTFNLLRLRATVRDEDSATQIMELLIGNVGTLLSTRPVKNCLKLEVNMGSMELIGMPTSPGSSPPNVLTTKKLDGHGDHLFQVLFETSPVDDSGVDQRIHVSAQPLEIVYHSKTVIELVRCFTLPADIQLSKLQAQTQAALNEWKERSTTGLAYLIESKGVVELKVDITAPYILVPSGGEMGPNKSVLIVDLGQIHLASKPRSKIELPKVTGQSVEEHQQSVLDKSYDSFNIQLRDLQILLTLPDEDYRTVLEKTTTASKGREPPQRQQPTHLFRSSHFEIQVDQCLVSDDVRLPKLKVAANLPLFDVDISEHRLSELIKLVTTLPLPTPKSDDARGGPEVSGLALTLADPTLAEAYAVTQITYAHQEGKKKESPESALQFIDLVAKFQVEAVRLRVSRGIGHSHSKTVLTPLVNFELRHIRVGFTSKTFGSTVDVDVGGLTLEAVNRKMPGLVGPLYLLKTPMTTDTPLLKFHMFMITPDCPPKYASAIKQHIQIEMSSLDVVLHQEALQSLMAFADETLESLPPPPQVGSDVETSSNVSSQREGAKAKRQVSKLGVSGKAIAKKFVDKKDILMQIDANLASLTVQMSTESKNIVKVILSKLEAKYTEKPHKKIIAMELTELKVLNLDASSYYTNILTVDDDKVIHVHVTMYSNATKGVDLLEMNKQDMKVKVKTGRANIVYLSTFVHEILAFVDNFEAAKDAVADASAAAAGVALENAEKVYTSSSRIALDIELDAPKILVPKNGQSSSGILADFGHLKIKNSFKKIPEGSNFVIVDEMTVVLEAMKMSRVLLDRQKQSVNVEVLMLDPLSAAVTVERNLSAEWYNGIPDISVVGRLEHVFLRASKEDYDTLMECLTENVAAAPPQPAVPVHDPRRRRSSGGSRIRRSSSRKSSDSEPGKGAGPIVPSKPPREKKEYCKMKIELLIVKTGFVMYEGSSNMDGRLGLVAREQNTAFADFSIDNISIGLTIWSNENMNCDIIVEDVNLEDVRPGTREIKHLIQRKTSSGAVVTDSGALVKVTYRKDTAGKKGTTMNIESPSLTLVLCLDYLLQIVGFFATAKPPTKPISSTDLVTSTSGAGDYQRKRVIQTIPEDEEEVEIGVVAAAPVEDEPMHIYITLGETDLLLVETMETINTNALLLNCEVSMKLASLGTKSNIMGAVNRLTLCTCIYNPDKRVGSRAEVISPMSVTFVMSTSDENGTLIDINISDIFIRLTAGTLELLIKISTTISAPSQGAEGTEAGKNYSDIWKVKRNSESNYWFLKSDAAVEVAEEALQLEEREQRPENKTVKMFEVAEDLVVRERLVLESGCIVLTFETGFGNNTTPILLVETDVDLQLFDWSKRLQFGGRLKLEAAYYNAIYGMWEFLVEPVENRHHGKVSHQAWELLFEYSTVDCVGTNTGDVSTPGSAGSTAAVTPTFMAITLASHSILELTITKTALEVLNMISKDFSEAVKALVSQRDVSTSPYTVVNDCGSDIELDLAGSGFALVRKGLSYDRAQLKNGTSLHLALVQSYDMTKHHTSILREQEGKEERLLKIVIPEYGFTEEVPVNRAEKRYYDLKKKTDWGASYGLIIDISVKDCSKIVTIRGVVQIQNELAVPVDVYAMDNSGNSLNLLGSAEKGKPFNVPLAGVYTKSCELFFAPSGHSVATSPYIWTSLMDKLQGVAYLTSKPRAPGSSTQFHIKVIGQVRQALWKGTNRKTIASQYCTITLKPPLILDNLLPIPLGHYISGTSELISTDRGHCVQITHLEIHKGEFELKLKIPEYENEAWVSTVKIGKSTQSLSTQVFKSGGSGSGAKIMSLGIHKEEADEVLVLHVYCPSWMVNRTGLDLLYKGEDKDSPVTRHPACMETPVLFSFPEKSFFSKKKAMVAIDGKSQSEWSEKFSLDVAGSCGSVTCPSPPSPSATSDYQVGVEIVLTSWGLTKTIIFTPRFYLVNQCSTSILVYEEVTSKAPKPMVIQPNKTIEFWPQNKVHQARERQTLVVAFEDDPTTRSKPVGYDGVHNTLLELPNKYGGVHVDVHMTEVKTMITFSNFIPGAAPALLVNATPDCTIEISEKGVDTHAGGAGRLLAPNTSQLVTWADPMGKRALTWTPASNGKRNTFTDKLHGDGTGLYEFVDGANVKKVYYWVCFLDGLQRVLLFTPDPMLCAFLQQARDIEVPTADYTIMLHGIGLSLVDNEKCKELMYMRVASSEVCWETSKPGKKPRFKPMPKKDSTAIEAAYQNYQNQKAIATPNQSQPVKSLLNLDIGIQVDFLDNKILSPKPLDLRRMFQHGLWLHYKQFPHSSQFHAKLNRLQIDNQLEDCIFRIVLAPIPPPKSVSASQAEPKPFAEVSIMQRMTAHSSVIQYKYFKVLVQEFHIRLDINFVNCLVDLFSNQSDRKVDHMVEFFNKDYEEACTTFDTFLGRHNTSQGQKHFYDFLHFSPLKIHVSFSMGGATQLSNNFLNLLLQSVGVTLTEIQDVVFKLACLELQHMFLSGDQLYGEAYSHYSSQAIKQLYVLVLGLDVIGNPYGLVMGVTEGVEAFFYEPFQGAIQGPGEFAEGLALGVRSLVGSTIGGAAGALGKITGTLGKGLAALTMDEDYQRKRRENLSKKNDVAEGMAQSSKGLVMGFVGGVTGVFTKPMEGAKSEGVGGFFKGLGKGAVGLVARPTAGIVDFTSGTFDAVKKATSTSIDVGRMRPSRHVPSDSVILPYVQHEAEGMQLLHELDKGKYTPTDTYVAHALVNPHGTFVLLLTNKRLFYLKKEELFGGMSIVRSHMWEELDGPPLVVEKGLKFLLKAKKKKKMSFSSKTKAKEFFVPLYAAEVCTWMLGKIETAMKTETLDGSTTSSAPASVTTTTPTPTPTTSSSHQNNQGTRNSHPK